MAERKQVLVLDPAHGGAADRGGSSWQGGASGGPNPVVEKDITLALAKAVKQRLDPVYDLTLTRDHDVNLSLSERAKQARDRHADLFLSLHFNATSDPAVDGSEAWVAKGASSASRALAQAIPRRLARAAGIADRGMRRADLGVLLPERHHPRTAACLVEVAFLTNPGEATRLRDAAYLGQLADALSEAVRVPAGVVSTQSTPVPVIELMRVQYKRETVDFQRGPAGFDAIFRGEFSSPTSDIVITGKLLMEENGSRREATPAERRKLVGTAVARGYTGRGVNFASAAESKIAADGTFTMSTTVGLDPGTPRIRFQIKVDLKDGREIVAEAIFRRRDLQGFLTAADALEKQQIIGPVDSNLRVAEGPFEFASSVRKMFQPAPGSPLTPLFDQVLFRNREVSKVAPVDSPEGWDLRRFEECQIGNDIVDIGHVLVGIEAHRRQKPDSQLPIPIKDPIHAEAFLSWAGDLGSALVPFALRAVTKQKADLHAFLVEKSGSADLLGDIDGINLGAMYDEKKSLTANLRAYYDARPFRRFHNFLANVTDGAGTRLFSLASGKLAKLDPAGRLRAANYIAMFSRAVVVKRKLDAKLSSSESFDLSKMIDVGSREMDAVVDHFFNFLEQGLAKE
jgi:N-acetylmuramoyl-L-alanine amidase